MKWSKKLPDQKGWWWRKYTGGFSEKCPVSVWKHPKKDFWEWSYDEDSQIRKVEDDPFVLWAGPIQEPEE